MRQEPCRETVGHKIQDWVPWIESYVGGGGRRESGEVSRVSVGCWAPAWNGEKEAEPWPQVGPPGVRAAGGFSFAEVRHRDKEKLKNSEIMKQRCPGQDTEEQREIHAEPKPGDLIEIFRSGYSHWALYVGDGYVVHLAPSDEFPGDGSSSSLSVLSRRGKVKRELLSDVVGGCRYQINNHLDHQYSPLSVNKIISSGKEMVGKELEYSLVNGNCEHFVTSLRYGKARSLQADTILLGAAVGLGAVAVGTVLASSVTENPLPNASDSLKKHKTPR